MSDLYSHVPYTAAFVLRFLCLYFCIVLLLLLCHVCYCGACKCLHGFGICVWFYPNKLMMMMMMMILHFRDTLYIQFYASDARAEMQGWKRSLFFALRALH